MIRSNRRIATRLGLLFAFAALAVVGAPGSASAAPVPNVFAYTNSTVEAGDQLVYYVDVSNNGDEDVSDPTELTVDLPAGLTRVGATGSAFFSCPGNPGDPAVTCTASLMPANNVETFSITAAVDAGATGTKTAKFELKVDGASSASTTRSVRVSPTPPSFGVEAFDLQIAADAEGNHFGQAAGHPLEANTLIDLNTAVDPEPIFGAGDLKPIEPVRNIEVDLPPGFVGNPSVLTQCRITDLINLEGPLSKPLCAPSSQVGILKLAHYGPSGIISVMTGASAPVYNLNPPTGVAARFGFQIVGVPTVIDATVRNGGDYGLTMKVANISEAIDLIGNRLHFWGVPAAESHDLLRSCRGDVGPDFGGPHCDSNMPDDAFLRNPTACTAPGVGRPMTVRVDSWFDTGNFDTRTIFTHDAPGYPLPPAEWGSQQGFEGCENVPFNPAISVRPTTNAAASPSGLEVDLTVPQDEEGTALSQSDLKKAVVTLPRGMTINPSSASGLGSCTSQQIGLRGTNFPAPAPIRFTPDAPNCPADSKIGTIEITSSALDHPINGSIYLAAQKDNPFGSLLGMYAVGVDPESGVVIKLPARVEAVAGDRLITTFDNNPQLPFSKFHFELFGGSRATLHTPPTCGSHTATAELTPWSGNAASNLSSSFTLTNGPGGAPCPTNGFDPKLTAGTANPLGGAFSPFSLRLTREDGTQELGALQATMPEGLIGKLAGLSYCPEAALASISAAEGTGAAQIANPSCPASSQVGTVTVGAGAGPTPFFTTSGRAYLAGPYKGAPLSLAVVTPAVAGPLDLGTVVVRNALRVDPTTTQLTAVSDPLPTSLFGIPLDLRDVRVDVNRPGFTLNPTSCDPTAVTSTITSAQGATANPQNRFQVANCSDLPFKPKLTFRLKGGTKRNQYPAFSATLTAKPGEANIERVQVALPRSEFLAQNHIKTICTRVQFAAEACPKGSVYGYAKATSPLLDNALEGPVYLRSSSNPLPDLVADLNGQIEVVLAGRIDTKNKGIRNTFDIVPDAPVSKFTLTMRGGKKGLLVNSRNICASVNKVDVRMDGQNGKTFDSRPVLKADCGKKAKKKRGAKKQGRR